MTSWHDLPTEILEYIFNFLRLDDWKQASLVCRQWLLLCSFRKLLANVVLTLIPEKHDSDELCRVLTESIRPYRNFVFKVYEDEDNVVLIILEKFQESAECVKIKSYYEMAMDLRMDYIKRLFGCIGKLKELRVQTIIDIKDPVEDGQTVELPIMPYLETLYLEFESLESACFDWCKIAPNVKQLYLAHNSFSTNFNQVMSFYCQQLRSLGISISDTKNYAFGNPVEFPLLKHLTVTCWANVTLDLAEKFFKSFSPNLTELNLGFAMQPEVLALIFRCFPLLETVRLYFILPSNGLQLLSELPKLKHLFLFRVTMDCLDLKSADCFNTLQQLSLKHVDIDMMDEFFEFLPVKMPNVTALEITEDGYNMIPLVCDNLSNLRHLTVVWDCYIQDSNFHRLEQLCELRLFYHSLEDKKISWTNLSRCPSVCKLLISNKTANPFNLAEREVGEWQALAQNFPFLKRLEIAKGTATRTDVDIIQHLLPDCDVSIVSDPVAFQSANVDATLQFEMAV